MSARTGLQSIVWLGLLRPDGHLDIQTRTRMYVCQENDVKRAHECKGLYIFRIVLLSRPSLPIRPLAHTSRTLKNAQDCINLPTTTVLPQSNQAITSHPPRP